MKRDIFFIVFPMQLATDLYHDLILLNYSIDQIVTALTYRWKSLSASSVNIDTDNV